MPFPSTGNDAIACGLRMLAWALAASWATSFALGVLVGWLAL